MLSGSFRSTQWDPLLLISQIIAMQSLLYVNLGAVTYILNLFFETDHRHRLDYLFDFREIHVTDVGGRLVICAFVLNSLAGAILLWLIVRRTKLCLDFSCTFHGVHLLICWWYSSAFPSTASFWLLNAVCATIMCVSGEFLCLRTELKEIPVGYSALSSKSDI